VILYDPSRYGEYAVRDLLHAVARGHIGVDRRLVRSMIERGQAAAGEALAFARENRRSHIADVDPLLLDLFRHWQSPQALEFLLERVREERDDVSDPLIEALLPHGSRAVEPLLALYHELGEEEGGEIAFLLAGLQIRDPRILELLLDRLEYSALEGAFHLGLYGDPAARPALETLLAEIPPSDKELRFEIESAIAQLGDPHPYEPAPFDILAGYPERATPPVDDLAVEDRLALLSAPDAETRAAAAYSFFNQETDPRTCQRLLEVARTDPDPVTRGRAWMSLAGATEDEAVAREMLAVAADDSRDVAERSGAAVGLYGVADRREVALVLDRLYREGGLARAGALEAMWRSLWRPYARYFPEHLDDPDPRIARQALRGAGYFQLTRYIDRIAAYFDRDDEADLREDALFAYALAMPGETTRGRVRGMFRKIDDLAQLDEDEAEVVKFALDERLRLCGLDPVFEGEGGREEAPAGDVEPRKVGRNDPCPCGSGKKYKKCHGA
jgi:hypothetical protein